MQPITISLDLANSIWGYLASRPFGEVGNLAVAFQQAVGAQVKAIEDAEKEIAVEPTTPAA